MQSSSGRRSEEDGTTPRPQGAFNVRGDVSCREFPMKVRQGVVRMCAEISRAFVDRSAAMTVVGPLGGVRPRPATRGRPVDRRHDRTVLSRRRRSRCAEKHARSHRARRGGSGRRTAGHGVRHPRRGASGHRAAGADERSARQRMTRPIVRRVGGIAGERDHDSHDRDVLSPSPIIAEHVPHHGPIPRTTFSFPDILSSFLPPHRSEQRRGSTCRRRPIPRHSTGP